MPVLRPDSAGMTSGQADRQLLGPADQRVVGGGGHDAGEADVQLVGDQGREAQDAALRHRHVAGAVGAGDQHPGRLPRRSPRSSPSAGSRRWSAALPPQVQGGAGAGREPAGAVEQVLRPQRGQRAEGGAGGDAQLRRGPGPRRSRSALSAAPGTAVTLAETWKRWAAGVVKVRFRAGSGDVPGRPSVVAVSRWKLKDGDGPAWSWAGCRYLVTRTPGMVTSLMPAPGPAGSAAAGGGDGDPEPAGGAGRDAAAAGPPPSPGCR